MKVLDSKVSKAYSILQRFPKDTLNNTTIQNLGNTAPIDIFPPEVYFKDIEPHQSYEVTVTVRNISKKVRRIKFSQPKTSKFKCDYDMQGPVAAGLAMKINVIFETDADGDFHDMIRISTEDNYTFDLHLHALKPAPDIQFEPLVNFGFIPINQTKSQVIEFRNEGRIEGSVSLKFGKAEEMKVEPATFTLGPEQSTFVKIELTAREPDFLRKLVEVYIAGQEKVRNIDISATSVEHNLSIVFEEGGGQATTIDFGRLYLGEKRECNAYLVNNGPVPCNYSFRFFQGVKNIDEGYNLDEFESMLSPSEAGNEMATRVMTAEPTTGFVGAYTQIPIKFICRTKKIERQFGFSDFVHGSGGGGATQSLDRTAKSGVFSPEKSEVNYSYLAVISFQEISYRLNVLMSANAGYPKIKLSKTILNFGNCLTNERRDYILKLENKNDDQPLDYAFSKLQVAHFLANPRSGRLLPQTTHSIIVTFEPHNLGVFNSVIDLELLKGVYKYPIKVSGTCNAVGEKEKKARGPGSSVDDFKVKHNFIDEHKINEQKPKALMNESALPKWLQETSTMYFDQQYKVDNTEKIDQFLQSKQNKQKYIEFIRDKRDDREKTKKVNDKLKQTSRAAPQTLEDLHKDPDLGLDDDDKALDSPKLSLPKQVDTLWVTKPIDKYEPLPSKHASKVEFNSEKLIKKKFNSEPKTQAEIRDCSEELKGEQLQRIHAGPKSIDFGSLFVKSTMSKNFSVTNELRQSIYVKLVIEGPELEKR